MSEKELSRLEVIQKVKAKQLTQGQAGKILKVSTRQIRNLLTRYSFSGPKGLISSRRDKPSSNRLPQSLREKAVALISSHYHDFGPTLANEKLKELHGLKLSVESTRQLMIASGIWKGKHRKACRIHQMRERRACVGELIQIDGSPHYWFEDRGPKCCLIVFVDDATSRLMALHFIEEECNQGYFEATRNYIDVHGLPACLYSDRHGIFRVNTKDAVSGTGETQFSRAIRELDIALINANSPQAKGRVERANGILQDRLVKELRLQNISDIKTANAFLPQFMADFNKRFEKEPTNPNHANRKNPFTTPQLNHILCQKTTRKINKNLEVTYGNKILQIQTQKPSYTMRNSWVEITDQKGYLSIWYKGRALPFKIFNSKKRPTQIADSKQINRVVNEARKAKYKPPITHPWKRGLITTNQENQKPNPS